MIPYFWVLLWENRRNVFWRVDLFFSAVLAAVISVCVDDYTLQERYQLILSTTGAATIGLFSWTLFHILSLVRNLAQHGINRALLASADDETKREPDAVGEDDAGA